MFIRYQKVEIIIIKEQQTTAAERLGVFRNCPINCLEN